MTTVENGIAIREVFQTAECNLEHITPDRAEYYLSKNRRNRPKTQRYIDAYARAMTSGEWMLTHQGIAFDSNDNLIDGQHRLHAIVQSSLTVPFFVFRGLDPSVQFVIDRLKARTFNQTMKMMGFETSTSKRVAIANRMMIGGARAVSFRINDTERKKFMDDHIEAIVLAESLTSGMLAAIGGAVARAAYHIDEDDLREFGLLLADPDTEVSNPSRSKKPVRLLRDLLLRRAKGNAGGSAMASIYRKTQRAIRAFLDGETVGRLTETSKELFPLPEGKYFPQIDVQDCMESTD